MLIYFRYKISVEFHVSSEQQVSVTEALAAGLTRLTPQLANHKLLLSDMSYVRVCLPQHGSSQISIKGWNALFCVFLTEHDSINKINKNLMRAFS